jgi:hypothetical protein
MMGLTEKMRQGESDIESRVPKMNYLVVQQDKSALMDKRVLWTEITVYKADLMSQYLFC